MTKQNHPTKMVAILSIIRIRHWIKNGLIFVPLLSSHLFVNTDLVLSAFLAFIVFCAWASCGYIFNDLCDVENDKKHKTKCERPLAADKISIFLAYCLIITGFTIAILLSFFINATFVLWLFAYALLVVVYSLYLKRLVIADIVCLAFLYLIRIMAGAAAINIDASFWLLSFGAFIFISLALVKRYVELTLYEQGDNKILGRGYSATNVKLIRTTGLISGYLSILVFIFYLQSDTVIRLYTNDLILWCALPILLFWISWVWLKAFRCQIKDDPILFASSDKLSLISGVAFFAVFIVAAFWGR